MNSGTAVLIDLGYATVKALLEKLTAAKAPQEILDGVQAATDALEKHWNDPVTKAALEAARG